jgi:hypothetical protein
MIGGKVELAATPTKLDDSSDGAIPCRIVTIRAEISNSKMFFGGSDGEPHGYLIATATAGESWTFGPFQMGSGIRPNEIYVWGTANDQIYWNGLEA